MRIALFLSLMLLASACFAQSTVPSVTFNHMALSVKDLNRSAAFYHQVMGLPEITNKALPEGIRWFSMHEGKELHLISISGDSLKVNKELHLAFATSDIDAFAANLDKMKVAYFDWQGTPHKINLRSDGVKQIYFQDPDGYWIEVNSAESK